MAETESRVEVEDNGTDTFWGSAAQGGAEPKLYRDVRPEPKAGGGEGVTSPPRSEKLVTRFVGSAYR